MSAMLRRLLTLACTLVFASALLAPVRAQTLPPFTGTYYGGITSYTQPTPTTQDIFESDTSTDATNGLDSFSAHYDLTIIGFNYFLTPNAPSTTDTFEFSAADGSSVSGKVTSIIGMNNGVSQTFTEVFQSRMAQGALQE